MLSFFVPFKVKVIKITNIRRMWTENKVYPGFLPYFYVACVILFGTLIIVFCDVARKLMDDRTKRRIKASYSKNGINDQNRNLLESNKV